MEANVLWTSRPVLGTTSQFEYALHSRLRVRCSSQVPRICFSQASFDTDPEYLTSIWDSVQLAILIALLRLLSRLETFGFLDSTKYTTSRFRDCCYKVSSPRMFECTFLTFSSARTTPLPTLGELENMFATVPTISPTASTTSQIQRIWLRLQRVWDKRKPPGPPAKAVNPFFALKSGKRSVVLAVVDAGTTSMFRFVDGCFEEWPMA